jgi:predicted acyl esterase
VRLADPASKTISPAVVDVGGAPFDPITGGGACATADGADQTGTATYRLTTPDPGCTLIGSPTVVAQIASAGANSQIAARLLDVAPSGQETLVARGLYRPEIGATATRQVFQLHPDAWKFEPGHVAKLELLPADSPYGRASNGQQPVTVSQLQLRLPVLQGPRANGSIRAPLRKFVPPGYGYALAPGYD